MRPVGTGLGRITGPGIDCPGDCSQRFFGGPRVQLAAHAGAGSRFVGWGDGCSGTGGCGLTITRDTSVTAQFDLGSSRIATSLELKTNKRSLRRGARAKLRVTATPCSAPRKAQVLLRRNGKVRDAGSLNPDCRARFRVRPRRSATFDAVIGADLLHEAASSDPLRIKVRGRRLQSGR